MMDEQTVLHYIRDIGLLLKEMALDAKREKRSDPEKFQLGRLMGFLEVISLMQSQAEIFGIPLDAIGLNDIEPEVDLL